MIENIEAMSLPNYGFLFADIPKNLLQKLKAECDTLENENTSWTSGVTGIGVPKHYYMKDENLKETTDFVMELKDTYLKQYPSFVDSMSWLSHSVPYVCGKPWFNVMRKHQFIPNHKHDGVLSFTAWIKMPYTIAKENSFGKNAGRLEFLHASSTGQIGYDVLPFDKTAEGRIMMFPAKLTHCVYPFFTSDDARISMAGNIFFDTEKSAV
jgi:hypothetical protein